jgi:tripartite-type tricarboxylate transporter receptor subunit TctC
VKFPRRQFLHLAASAVALPALSRFAKAQAYPTRPVRIVVGFAAGGAGDITARLIGQGLSERLGQQFIVENRPGAGSNFAAETVVRSPADGYTLLFVSSPHAFNATLYDKLNYNLIRDIAPVASATLVPGVMEVNPLVSAKTVPEFIAFARANPGKINMAAPGAGSATHIFGELFKMMAGVDLVPMQYRGSGPALTDLMGGQVQVIFSPVPESIEYTRAGKLRPLAVTTATRLDVLPNVPTVGEFVPGYEAVLWQGIGAPKNTPAEIVDRLNKEINAALADPKMKARFADLGSMLLPGSPAAFGKLIADETEKWGKVIRAANIKPLVQ